MTKKALFTGKALPSGSRILPRRGMVRSLFRSLPRAGGFAAAAAIAASGAGAPGLSQSAWAQSQGALAVEFAPYAVIPAIKAPVAGAVDITRIDPADEDARTGSAIGSGMASWYGKEFAGRRTASGERFDPAGFTAAHRTLPFGSKVRVTNERTGESVVVRINDRGPFTQNRLIDVSHGAARELGLIGPGHGRVSLALIEEEDTAAE